jgi:hypothetical protein
MSGYSIEFLWKEVLYPVVASTRTTSLKYIIKLHVLSHIINHEHVSIAFATIIRIALQGALRITTAKVNKWKH